jgi:hypothetical protein
MNSFALNIDDLTNGDAEPRAALILAQDGEEQLRREIRIFSEDDVIAASNAMTGASGLSQVDVDQAIAETIEPIRIKWLRTRDRQPDETAAEEPGTEGPQAVVRRYIAVLPSGEGKTEPCIRDVVNDRVLSNFILILTEDIEVQDDIESWREFAGTLTTPAGTSPFRIRAADFADNSDLKAALFAAGGCELVIHANMDELRRAISTISKDAGGAVKRTTTTNFGWTADRTAYLTPSLRISGAGVEELDDKGGLKLRTDASAKIRNPDPGSEQRPSLGLGISQVNLNTTEDLADVRVDLGSETPACYLGMKKLDGAELVRVQRHVVEDLLRLSDPIVTHTLLGATAAAVLYPFAKGAGRFALWLVGLTGSGKSFAAKLFANFFGDFPVSSAPFTTWASTGNYVQRQGYFFKDALYLVDDFKPELQRYPGEVARVLQAYADNTARGRLKSDATANTLRMIRGLLVSTGEDVPEHNASAVARSVIVRVPQQAKNVDAGKRCLSECENYSGVMADFIRWLLAEGKMVAFADRFTELQKRFNDDVAGQQNDIRVATNLALLGAAFEQFAEYLGDVWEGWQEASRKFIEEDLVAIRDAMLGEAKEQQASEVFLRMLGDLIRFNHVRINELPQQDAQHKPIIGRMKLIRTVPGRTLTPPNHQCLEICTSLALMEVNRCLQQTGKQPLRITESALLQQLRDDGRLLDANGQPLKPDDDPTRRVRLDKSRQVRAFRVSRSQLLADG